MRIAHVAFRILIAAVFILSAVAKLFAIDQFELYVYSFGFFPLNLCFLLARLCIGAELALALLTLTGWFPRLTRMATLGLLLLFSLFLAYAALAGRSESCQCFGQWVEMPPAASLLKNALLLLLVLVCYRTGDFHGRKGMRGWRWLLPLLGLAACFVSPFIVSVPDNWYFGPSREPYNEEALSRLATPLEGQETPLIGEGRTLLAFVTPSCPYCRLAREKLSSMASRHHLDTSRLHFIEPHDLPEGLFIEITYGNRPLIMLVDSTQVKATYHLRNIDEKEVAMFLKK